MLSNPDILFLNCLGSYFYSIIDYMEKGTPTNSLLYFLSDSNLKYSRLNLNEVQKKYGDNPWGYQPLLIVNSAGNKISIENDLFNYLKNTFNISVEKIDLSNNKAYLGYLTCNSIDNYFHICKVDEFYLKNSQNFYMKKHNKHYLLIRNINIEKNCIEIIDSEINKIYTISYQELYQAFYENDFRSKIYYRINCSNFANNAVSTENMRLYLAANNNIDYLASLFNEMEQMLNPNDSRVEYFYKGYRYTILSKIVPMTEMKKHLFLYYPDENVLSLINTLTSLWKEICAFMLYKITRRDFTYLSLQKRFSKIYKLEERLYRYIIDNSKQILENIFR